MELPTKPIAAIRTNPKRLVIFAKAKCGKTSALAQLENNLIIDLENGTDFLSALKIKINNLTELRELGDSIIAANYPYKYVTIDTVTMLEEVVKPLSLKLYKATTMGANFKGDDVLKLPNGAGL